MSKQFNGSLAALIVLLAILAGCATPTQIDSYDYSALRESAPRSILVVPAVNKSVEVDAPDYYLSTAVKPLAERGYYVFPVHLVKRLMEDDGLSDADLVHAADPTRVAGLFGADAVLYVSIERWDAQYSVFSTTVTVDFSYVLRDGKTGDLLWQTKQHLVYTPQNNNNSGNALADLIASMVVAAVEKAKPSYVPLTQQANSMAFGRRYRGIPAGPYHVDYLQDQAEFEGVPQP